MLTLHTVLSDAIIVTGNFFGWHFTLTLKYRSSRFWLAQFWQLCCGTSSHIVPGNQSVVTPS